MTTSCWLPKESNGCKCCGIFSLEQAKYLTKWKNKRENSFSFESSSYAAQCRHSFSEHDGGQCIPCINQISLLHVLATVGTFQHQFCLCTFNITSLDWGSPTRKTLSYLLPYTADMKQWPQQSCCHSIFFLCVIHWCHLSRKEMTVCNNAGESLLYKPFKKIQTLITAEKPSAHMDRCQGYKGGCLPLKSWSSLLCRTSQVQSESSENSEREYWMNELLA